MSFVIMTFYGDEWESTRVMHNGDRFDTVEDAERAVTKANDYAPNLCIWIAKQGGQDQYLQPRFQTIKYIQHEEKSQQLAKGWSEWLRFVEANMKKEKGADVEYKEGSKKRTLFLKELIERV